MRHLRNRGLIIDGRSQINCHPGVSLPLLPRKLRRDHDQRWSNTLREMKKLERRHSCFHSLSLIFLKRCSSYPRYSADIPGNHVSRRDYGVKNKGGTRRGRRRGKGGTKRSNASLMTVRKFQREWIIHGGKQKGVEVVSDRAMHRGLNRYNASCTSACVIIFLSLLQQTGWKLG